MTSDFSGWLVPAWVFVTARLPTAASQMKETVVSILLGSLHPRHISSTRKEAVASTHRTGSFCREACLFTHSTLLTPSPSFVLPHRRYDRRYST
ncbi:hypothetical protein BDR04DRAFT_1085905 [Suillus decipiens]|nr:hypothetical protein BDR04DRAFT_1085905 [Suillus decipiens]